MKRIVILFFCSFFLIGCGSTSVSHDKISQSNTLIETTYFAQTPYGQEENQQIIAQDENSMQYENNNTTSKEDNTEHSTFSENVDEVDVLINATNRFVSEMRSLSVGDDYKIVKDLLGEYENAIKEIAERNKSKYSWSEFRVDLDGYIESMDGKIEQINNPSGIVVYLPRIIIKDSDLAINSFDNLVDYLKNNIKVEDIEVTKEGTEWKAIAYGPYNYIGLSKLGAEEYMLEEDEFLLGVDLAIPL